MTVRLCLSTLILRLGADAAISSRNEASGLSYGIRPMRSLLHHRTYLLSVFQGEAMQIYLDRHRFYCTLSSESVLALIKKSVGEIS
jgi:hypothetical protein